MPHISITFTSIIKHDLSLPQALRLVVPATIAPRYGYAPATIKGTLPRTKMDITISVTMTGAISSITSPTHPIALSLGVDHPSKVGRGAHDPVKAHVAITGREYLDTDIIIIIASQHLDLPRCVLETSAEEQTSAFALSFVPQFNLPPLPSQCELSHSYVYSWLSHYHFFHSLHLPC